MTTVAMYAERWFARLPRTRARHTREAYRGALDRYVLPDFGALDIRTVTRRLLRETVITWLDRGLGLTSLRPRLRPLIGLLDDAMEDGEIDANPARGLARAIVGKRAQWLPLPERAMWDTEFARFIEAAATIALDRLPYWLTLHRTGIRPGEGLALGWDDIDLVSGALRVWETYSNGDLGAPKSRQDRWIALSTDCLDALRGHQARAAPKASGAREWWCFPSHRVPELPWSSSGMCRLFRQIADRAGLRRELSAHSLRHTWATWSLESGLSKDRIQRVLGHASIVTTELYVRAARTIVPQADMNRIDARVRHPPRRIGDHLVVIPHGGRRSGS